MFSSLRKFRSWSQMTDLPMILVDHRERLGGLAEELRGQAQFEVEVCHLDSGDVAVGSMGIERKTHADFYRSLEDGRLFRQLFLLKRSYSSRLLIIEGLDPHGRNAGVRGALAKITAGLQVPVLFTSDVHETALYIQSIAIQLAALHQRTYRPHRPVEKRDVSFQQIFFLAGLPGIGPGRARALLTHFGSLERILSATVDELQEVPGIGRVVAGELRALLGESFSPNA